MKKYELTSKTIIYLGRTLHRIRALVPFGSVDAGDLGGWIENENNLGQYDDAWVYDEARVYGNALVCGNTQVYGNAQVYEDAEVSGNARVSGNAEVYGHARVYGDTKVSDHVRVYGNALVGDNAEVYGNALVYGNAWVCGDARIFGNASIMTISHIGSRLETTTFFALKNGKIGVRCGCFYGDIDEFAAKVEQTHGNNQHGKAYKLAIELAKLRLQTRKE